MKIEIMPFITTAIVIMTSLSACAILATSISVCAAVEYKTLDAQYYKAEYPADWIVNQITTNSIAGGGVYPTIAVGVNGVGIYQTIDSKSEGMFKKDGYINEPVIHFYETFQVKKPATTNVTEAPEYKVYENEYFKVEYPVDWIVYPNEKKCSYHFQVPIPGRSWGANTNVTWNVECYDAAEVGLGLDGATVRVQVNKNYTGSFLNDGFIDKGLIHFLKTFKVKSYPTPVL